MALHGDAAALQDFEWLTAKMLNLATAADEQGGWNLALGKHMDHRAARVMHKGQRRHHMLFI